MGQSLAMALLEADIPVTMFDPDIEALQNAMTSMRASYRICADEGGISGHVRDRRIGFLVGTSHIHHLKDCDVIVETTSCDLNGKKALFHKLDEIAKPNAILTANASASIWPISAV